MIEPSTGRIVLYRAGGVADPTPHAAIVIAVANERAVNLACFSPEGTYYHRIGVTLLQDDDAAPAEGGYAEWMAFQKGQAVKTEAAESQLHPRVAALEAVLIAGGPIHAMVQDLQAGVEAKFQEVGDYLTKAFQTIDDKIAAVSSPADPAANPGQPAPGSEAQGDVSGAGAAPQGQA